MPTWRQAPGTASRSRTPEKRSVSPSRAMVVAASAARIDADLAGSQFDGDLADRLAGQFVVELGAEGLHEGHAFDHHVEHLPAVAGLAHEVVDRDRLATLAQQLAGRSEEHTSELQSLMRNSYAVFCLKKQHTNEINTIH